MYPKTHETFHKISWVSFEKAKKDQCMFLSISFNFKIDIKIKA
jgi:hypothetical protein